MASPLSLYFFGDQDSQFKDNLGALLLTGSNPILNNFFDKVALSLRQEVQTLSWSQRDHFPSFSNILDLLSIDPVKPLHPALQLALSSTHHLAVSICRKTWEIDNSVPTGSEYVLGLGSGSLAAAALSCYSTSEQFIPVALESVLVGFRIGLLAASIRDQIIEGSNEAPWRTRIETDKPEALQSQIQEFSTERHLQAWTRPYICGISDNSLLLCGSPAIIEQFVSEHNLKTSNSAIHCPFHASHIFSENDVETIIQTVSPEVAGLTSKCTLLSHQDGKALPPQSLRSLLRRAVRAILREDISSKNVLRSIKDMVHSHVSQSCTVLSIGTSHGSGLRALLGDSLPNTKEVVFVNDESIVKDASTPQHARQPKIAVTGFSGRFPQAESIESFWDIVLRGGVDTHSEAPKSRWDIETHVDPLVKRKNTSGTPYGCWLDNPGLFDRSFFSISPREAPQMDPAQRMALMCAYEAVEMAGLVPDSSPSTMKSRVGVFIGSTSNDWCETNSAQDVDNYFIPGGNRAFIPGRVNFYFKFSGPSFSIDTACSSSLAATHLACNALWRNDIDTAIVGGTNVLTNPDVTAGLDRGHFLSRTGNCKTFDDEADGYCRGEGVGIVILKRVEDAKADNDPIYGCILAAATNHSAEAESITRPHVGAQQALFSDVLAKGGVQPKDISYVEMHGTGTQAGDGREMASVSQTFAPWLQGDPRCRQDDLYVGSVKANVGHGESVAGVTALIKVLLMMQKNEIPPHCGIKTKINQTFPTDLDERRIRIAKAPTAWARASKPRRVLVNNFSAAGGNSCVLIEDGPDPATYKKTARPDTRPAHVITLSAKSKAALEANTRGLAHLLQSSAPISVTDLAYTSTARRLHYNFRSSYQASSTQVLINALEQDIANPPQQFRGPPKMIFAFSGQGSNHPGMGKTLYDTNSVFKTFLDRFDTITQDQGFGSILPYLRGMDDKAQQACPLTVQLGHVSLQMALARLWESWGISPVGVIGHSLGEYAALNFAGVLSDFDVLWICGQRAKLLASHCQEGAYAMLAVRSSQEEVTNTLDGIRIEIACINGPRDTVISGAIEDIDRSALRLDSTGTKYSRMKLPYAFHSSQLQPIMDDFSKILDGLKIGSPKLPVLSPLRSAVINPGTVLGKDYLLRQCRETVNLVGAIKAGEDAKLLHDRTHVIEMGPSLVLARLVQRTMENSPTTMPSLEPNQDSWLVLSRSVATAYRVGCNINWAQYHRDYDHAVVQLPSYNWDLKNYWIQYVHDWSLRKGDPLPPISEPASRFELATASCQKVISVESQGDLFHAVAESDLQSKELRPVVAGHKVNGVAVCIGSAYADMAYSFSQSILKHFHEDVKKIAILVQDMYMQEALIINDTPEPQIVSIDAKYAHKQGKVEFEISSAHGHGTKLHAKVIVAFADRQKELENLHQRFSSIGSQIDLVKNNVISGQTERFTTSMAYRMVASLAHYDSSHKGVKEAYLNSSTLEAHSVISTPAPHRIQGNFSMHPCVFDSILQLATFVLNANENSRFDQEVYVVRGWETVFIDGILSPDGDYETYVKMTEQDKDVAFGDIAIKKGNALIGCMKGVRVQRVPRRLMDVMFKPKVDTGPISQPASTNVKMQGEVNALPKNADSPSKLDKALAIISEESGISIPEMKDEDQLSDLGIDSLLILVIASRFREELYLDLSPIFFVEYGSIGGIKAYFVDQEGPSSPASGADSDTSSNSEAEKSSTASSAPEESDLEQADAKPNEQVKVAKKTPRSTSILLQGTIGPNTKTMFMFPDGSGSATSYMHLPRVHEDVAVVAMNCPYMTTPQDFEGSFEDITKILLAEVRRRQPKGPYWIGGWSAGGAFAHYAARLLSEAGEQVKALLLIDAPCPIGLGKLPQCFFDYWKMIHQPGGPVEDRPLPPWIMDHFQAVNENLRWYNASPLPRGHSPRTYLIWAAKGTDNLAGFPYRHLLTPEESEDLGFLMDDKTDFGTRGWERLVEGDIWIERAMTSNHFTITRNEGAKMVSELIKKACILD